jgi:hypothetical protein
MPENLPSGMNAVETEMDATPIFSGTTIHGM